MGTAAEDLPPFSALGGRSPWPAAGRSPLTRRGWRFVCRSAYAGPVSSCLIWYRDRGEWRATADPIQFSLDCRCASAGPASAGRMGYGGCGEGSASAGPLPPSLICRGVSAEPVSPRLMGDGGDGDGSASADPLPFGSDCRSGFAGHGLVSADNRGCHRSGKAWAMNPPVSQFTAGPFTCRESLLCNMVNGVGNFGGVERGVYAIRHRSPMRKSLPKALCD